MAHSDLDKLLSTTTLAQLRSVLAAGAQPASPGQANQLAAHARTLAPATTQPLRIAFVHTYTSDLLDPWLGLAGAVQGIEVLPYHAPYGIDLQQAQAGSALLRHQPQLTVMLLQREDLHPALARPVTGLSADEAAALQAQALERVQEVMAALRAQDIGHLVLTFLPRLAQPGLGLYEAQAEHSDGSWWAQFKTALSARLRALPSSLLLDLDEVMTQVGRSAFVDRRFWYSARFPFSAAAAREFARRLVAVGVGLLRPKAKVLVLDADNTLWGGVVGEDGFDGIQIGPDHPGNAYLDFQRRLLDFQQRGLLLALCSKNNAADVDQVLKEHPHMLLRDEHFSARRVNWLPKPDNLASLAEELNLGLDAFVFVDDSDHECAAVRHALPQVEVVQVPARAVDIPTCLDEVARLEILSLTREDLAKTEMYAQERRRRELMAESAIQGADYLSRLKMKMTVRIDAGAHVPRLAQLTNKTNQFNLTTRRYDEARMQALVRDPSWWVADFSLADVFGDSGIVGLALLHLEAADRARIDTLLMSCRVIGRQAESAFLNLLLRRLAQAGVTRVRAEYLPTRKNELVKDFLADHRFVASADGAWERDLAISPPQPEGDFPIETTLDPSP